MNTNNLYVILSFMLFFSSVSSDRVGEIFLCDFQAATTFTGDKSSISGWDCHNGLSATSVCSWSGVECLNSAIVSITFNSFSLSGTIPTSLGLVKSLTLVSFNNNQLQGSIPTSLGELSSLKRLLLQFNALTGTIPETIANLSSLVNLLINSNSFSGSIPESICTLPLDIVQLQSNQFKCYQSCLNSIDTVVKDNIPLCSLTEQPSSKPTSRPSEQPSTQPTSSPISQPSDQPPSQPSLQPLSNPTSRPSGHPSIQLSSQPSPKPTLNPSNQETSSPCTPPSQSLRTVPTSNPSLITVSVIDTKKRRYVIKLKPGYIAALAFILLVCCTVVGCFVYSLRRPIQEQRDRRNSNEALEAPNGDANNEGGGGV